MGSGGQITLLLGLPGQKPTMGSFSKSAGEYSTHDSFQIGIHRLDKELCGDFFDNIVLPGYLLIFVFLRLAFQSVGISQTVSQTRMVDACISLPKYMFGI